MITLYKIGKLIFAVFLMIWPGLQISYAEESQLADPSAMPYILLLDEFKIYPSEETNQAEALGSISAMQTVHMAPIPNNRLLYIMNLEKIPVETWLGIAWINLKEGAYKYGQIKYKEQTLNLLESNTRLYDSRMKSTDMTLSPQTVVALASIEACDPYTPCRTNENWYQWYLIQTSWSGQMWIRPDHYAEKYVGKPVEGMIPIAEDSAVYLYPFENPLNDEPELSPQILKPVAKYTELARMTPPSVWYQVETPKGLRWIQANANYGLGIEVAPVDIQQIMPVPFHYYRTTSFYYAQSEEQSPQTLHAIGKTNNWYFVIDHTGVGQWVNPSKKIASRMTGDYDNDTKLGMKLSDKRLNLNESSIARDIPYVDGESMNDTLTFTPQTVTASRSWISPNGEIWYYIHTWQGAKWVLP